MDPDPYPDPWNILCIRICNTFVSLNYINLNYAVGILFILFVCSSNKKLSNTVFLSYPYTQQYLESKDFTNFTNEIPCYS